LTGVVGTSASERLIALGLTLPEPPTPKGTYVPVALDDRRAYVSGQIVTEGGVAVHPGRVGREVDLATAQQIARRATLQALSALAASVGSIDRIHRVIRVGVYVATADGFDRPQEVGNGATDLLVDLFGEAGRPARVSMGVAVLPLNAPVEVELLVEIR
jgi:enamine deaminase RidA (YjgF/YER057c/UK114 family)